MRPRGSKNPKAGNPAWTKGVSGNPRGRPKLGMSFKERCLEVAGDGRKLAWLYGCLGGILPVEAVEKDFGSSGLQFATRIRQFMRDASVHDRLNVLARLEDRAFGLIKQEVQHSGQSETVIRWAGGD